MVQTFLRIDKTKVRHLIDVELKDKSVSPKQLYDKILKDPDLQVGVHAVLGQLETVSIAVQLDYADKGTLFYALSYLVPWAYFGLEHYIDETRKFDANPELYVELEKLAHAWRQRKSLITTEVFPASKGARISQA